MHDHTSEIHIRAATRPDAETERLLRDLTAYCWPGGTEDQSDPVARGWLRHFAAIVPIFDVPACACEQGHCTSCN
jgi:hypothetical protein